VALRELLAGRRDAVLGRWVERVVATYPEGARRLFLGQKDPFANPVGRAVRDGTAGVFDALLSGGGEEAYRAALGDLVAIRAVQQFRPSGAVGFVFGLKEAVRDELAGELGDPGVAREMPALEAEVDAAALAAVDLYVEARERVAELRIDEAKRRVEWVVDRLGRRERREGGERGTPVPPAPDGAPAAGAGP
jgi:hypothetical protein